MLRTFEDNPRNDQQGNDLSRPASPEELSAALVDVAAQRDQQAARAAAAERDVARMRHQAADAQPVQSEDAAMMAYVQSRLDVGSDPHRLVATMLDAAAGLEDALTRRGGSA